MSERYYRAEDCRRCQGTGKVWTLAEKDDCPACKGTGTSRPVLLTDEELIRAAKRLQETPSRGRLPASVR